jgi:hypothetical protein
MNANVSLNTTRYLACSLVVNYMHDAMNKILELIIKLKSSTTHKIEQIYILKLQK